MPNYEEDLSAYKTISILGQCFDCTAIVHLAKHISSGTMVAIKKFNMDKIKEGAHLVEREIILTKQLHHPNIITYYNAFVTGPQVCVVSPLMAYGSCRDLLTRHFNEGLPEQAIVLITRDVLDGLDYIHKKGYIHRYLIASRQSNDSDILYRHDTSRIQIFLNCGQDRIALVTYRGGESLIAVER